MTQDEIIRFAIQCRLVTSGNRDGLYMDALTEFAKLVAAKALAQPEQEPVAWRTFDGEGGYDYRSYEDNESYADDWDKRNPNHKGWVDKLYTHSQPKQELTNIERHETNIEKFLGAPQQPEQVHLPCIEYIQCCTDKTCPKCKAAAIPQRTFVGLTDEEIEYVWRRVETSDFHDCVLLFAKELEAKLKQKNGFAEEKNS